jgi:hypothetical protein
MLFLFSSNLFGQQDFTVEISLDNPNFWNLKNLAPLNVKITNNSEKALNTETIKYFNLYFSKCPIVERCNRREDNMRASASIEQKMLNKNASFEFQINLANLHWSDPVSSAWNFREPKNIQVVPIWNKYFFVDITVVEKYVELENSEKLPVQKNYRSNEIVFETKP